MSSGEFLVRLREAAGFREFGNLKTVADPQAYFIRLHFFSEVQSKPTESVFPSGTVANGTKMTALV